MKFWGLLWVVLLTACQTTPSPEQLAEREQLINQYHEMMKSVDDYKLALDKKHSKPTNIKLWAKMVHYKFNKHFSPTDSMMGHKVKIGINLDDNGFVKSTELISSSGDIELYNLASNAIKKAGPFPISGLSESDKKVARNPTFTFAP